MRNEKDNYLKEKKNFVQNIEHLNDNNQILENKIIESKELNNIEINNKNSLINDYENK